jgi:hypothetical protein
LHGHASEQGSTRIERTLPRKLRGGRPVNFYSIQFLQIVINQAARILRLIDLNLFPVNEDIHQYAQNIADQPGQYIVGGHGSPTSMYGPDGAALTPAEVAAQIEFDNNYSPGEPVTLVSCDTGAPASDGSPSFAEQLADDLGAPGPKLHCLAYS